ncbi:MAG: DUF998 domain-containing protein [Brevundimonas sp.]|uniref:DUF998 domain-containing protein n=1 Tax=Brevundimonas sp. TaxID=1871086 RepID=UPI001A322668|nr:DUF998 domain-containing protein [Brevundimonas sp.]MBJ7448301.1 DUF998 domain-containing protein [Brevundimonas sp.]
MLRKLTILCGTISLLILAVVIIAAPFGYPGYNPASQYVSEMGAVGTTTGSYVSMAFMVSGLLLAAFWLLCAAVFPRSPLAVIGFILCALNGAGLFFGGVFPCDFECAVEGASPSGLLHEMLGGLGYLLGVAGVFVLAIASRSWPGGHKLLPLGLACGIVAALMIPIIGPEFPWHGAAQRMLEAAFATWTIAVMITTSRLAKPPA